MLTSVPRFMAKPGSGSGSDSNKASQNVVFVDTSLDTHLALFVSDSDTVSDLKSNLFLPSPETFFLFCFWVLRFCFNERFLLDWLAFWSVCLENVFFGTKQCI